MTTPPLLPVDDDDSSKFSPPPFFLHGIAAGFVGFVTTFLFVRNVIVPKYTSMAFQKYVQISMSTQEASYFYSKLPSTLHSIVHCVFHPAWISFGYSIAHNDNRVLYFDDSWPAFFSGIFVGYLVADFIMIGPKDLGVMYCIHHIAASWIWTFSTCYRSMQWYGSFMQFCEFSTIFMNLRSLLLTAGYPSNSTLVTVASLSFFLSFFAVRVYPLPRLVYQWITKDYTLLYEYGPSLAIANSITLIIHVLLQSFWFLLMIKKLIATIVSGGKSKTKQNKEW